MKKLTFIIIVILFFITFRAEACLIEYRIVEYKPDKTQITAPYSGKYIQDVSEDFIMVNFTNNYSFTITDVNITYKNISVHIPVVNPKETIKSTD